MSSHRLPTIVFQLCKALQEKVDEVYKDQAKWNKMSILSTAGSGFFSSDRTIQDYVDTIWKCEPCKVPDAVRLPTP